MKKNASAEAWGMSFLMMTALSCATPGQPGTAADLERYVIEARRDGMSEGARGTLWQVAAIRTGAIVVTYPKDETTGVYFDSYNSTTCPNPKQNPEVARKFQEKMSQATEAEVKKLKPLADADGSGFVSSDEGEAFRRLVEFGYKASFISKQKGRGDLHALAKALGQADDVVLDQAVRYKALVKHMGSDSKLPPIPL